MQLLEIRTFWRRHRHDGTAHARAHRGQVRDRGGHRFEAKVLQWEIFRIEMDAQNGDISADHSLSHEGREDRGVVADVPLARWNIT